MISDVFKMIIYSVFFKDTLIVGVLKGLKSCGGIQYGSLLITIFNHKILIHNLEFLHFCIENNKFIINHPKKATNTNTLPRSVLYWGYYGVLYKYLDSF